MLSKDLSTVKQIYGNILNSKLISTQTHIMKSNLVNYDKNALGTLQNKNKSFTNSNLKANGVL